MNFFGWWLMNSRSFSITLLLSCVVCTITALAESPGTLKSEPLAATVAGQPIYETDLNVAVQAQMLPLERQAYDVKRKALDILIERKLLEAAARKKGATVEMLLREDVDAKLPEPSEAELQAYYLGQKDKLNRPFDEIKDQIRVAFTQARLQRARQEYLSALRSSEDVTVLLSPPKSQVGYDPSRLRGDAKAPVMIVEFSDFQCPYCRQMRLTLNNLLAKYGDKVSLAYRDFPLANIHAQAELAAEASRCAAEQGKFWEYHDRLLSSSDLSRESLLDHARAVKLDETQFDSCLATGKHKAEVQKDVQEGRKAGVSGTPALFVNGVFLNGSQPLDVISREIDEALARAR